MNLKEKECDDVQWIHLAQDRVQWQAVVNTITNFEFHKRWEIPSPAKQKLASQKGLCSKELL
jgi:hypothetical protein